MMACVIRATGMIFASGIIVEFKRKASAQISTKALWIFLSASGENT